jgi:hypothetical protein
VRLALGEYFQSQSGSYFTVSFNTHEPCAGQVTTSGKSTACSQQSITLPSYTSYVHTCRLGMPDPAALQGEFFRVSYEVATAGARRQFEAVLPHWGQGRQRYLVVGDWGVLHTKHYEDLFPCLARKIDELPVSAIIFVGDMAYDLETNDGAYY